MPRGSKDKPTERTYPILAKDLRVGDVSLSYGVVAEVDHDGPWIRVRYDTNALMLYAPDDVIR